ncbi:MAG TPA: hypothetical protein ENN43_05890, partial [bacterium]|nr:hypothetical protein [bacterium]
MKRLARVPGKKKSGPVSGNNEDDMIKNSGFRAVVFTLVFAVLYPVILHSDTVSPELGEIPDPAEQGVYEVEPASDMPHISEGAELITGLRAVSEGLSVNLNWDPAIGAIMFYDVYRSVNPDSGYKKINRQPLNTVLYTDNADNSMEPPLHKTTYYYRVVSRDEGGKTVNSPIVTASVFGPLVPPRNLSASAAGSTINIKWAEPESTGDNPLSGYNIYRSINDGEPARVNSAVLTRTAYADTDGITQGVKYTYAVQSVDVKGGMSELSAPETVFLYEGTTAPRNLTVTGVSAESIKLVWDEPESQGAYPVIGYEIFRTTVPGDFSEGRINERMVRPLPGEDGRLFYYDNIINSVSEPKAGEEYYYKVAAVDSMGNTGQPSAVTQGRIEYIEIRRSGILSADISQYGLPPDSSLKISGKKSVSINLIQKWYDKEDPNRQASTFRPDIEQPLRLLVTGNIGSKIFVDVNYEDNTGLTSVNENTKISIRYEGEAGETLQEFSFGDITLDLPPTRYVSYSQTLFGLRARAAFGDKLSVSAIAAQTKGITAVQRFTGTLREKEINGRPGVVIDDTSYYRNIYFYLTKNISHVTALDPFHTGA